VIRNVSEEHTASIFYPEDGSRIFLRNMGRHLPDHIPEDNFFQSSFRFALFHPNLSEFPPSPALYYPCAWIGRIRTVYLSQNSADIEAAVTDSRHLFLQFSPVSDFRLIPSRFYVCAVLLEVFK
jgi:hypothetical protein